MVSRSGHCPTHSSCELRPSHLTLIIYSNYTLIQNTILRGVLEVVIGYKLCLIESTISVLCATYDRPTTNYRWRVVLSSDNSRLSTTWTLVNSASANGHDDSDGVQTNTKDPRRDGGGCARYSPVFEADNRKCWQLKEKWSPELIDDDRH